MKTFFAFAVLLTLEVSSSVSALKCHQWTEDDDATKGKITRCEPGSSDKQSCALIGLEGFNRITRQKLTLTHGMCDNTACNATQLCNMALKNIRNFDVTECNAKCCDSDMCNAIPSSTTPTEGMQTIPIRRVSRSTKRFYRTIDVPMITDDGIDEFDFTPPGGINCFSCEEGSDLDVCNIIPTAASCGSQYDSCVSITGTLADDVGTEVAYRGCGLAEINCNVTQLCIDVRNKLFVNHGRDLASCYGYCCRTDFCNNFNPTHPIRFKSRVKTNKSRRTAPIKTHPSQSPSLCYECKPEKIGTMCNKSMTANRTCSTGNKEYDSCFSMTASITNATTNEMIDTGEWSDCGVRDIDCNANSSRCDTLSFILQTRGLMLKNCIVNCCEGDLCNDFTPTAGSKISAQALSRAEVSFVGNTVFLTGLPLILFFVEKILR